MNNLINLYAASGDYSDQLTDLYGRSRIFNSKSPDIFSPLISEKIYSKGLRPFYPDNKPFAFCLSHDIDLLYLKRRSRDRALSLFGKNTYSSIDNFRYTYYSVFKERKFPSFSIKKLDAINKAWNIHSSYYFLALQNNDQDYNYDINELRDDINLLQEGSNEVGLHGGHKAYNNLQKLNQEKELLESVIKSKSPGYRNHYLRFDIQNTWKILTDAGFEYDTTFGYPDCVGFKNGMCYPFFPYDYKEQRFLEIIELPLIVMDATFFYYMHFDYNQIKLLVADLLKKTKAIGGVFTLLWHNNNITGKYLKLYNQILEIILKEDPWIATSFEAVNWWKKNGLLSKQKSFLNELFEKENSSKD